MAKQITDLTTLCNKYVLSMCLWNPFLSCMAEVKYHYLLSIDHLTDPGHLDKRFEGRKYSPKHYGKDFRLVHLRSCGLPLIQFKKNDINFVSEPDNIWLVEIDHKLYDLEVLFHYEHEEVSEWTLKHGERIIWEWPENDSELFDLNYATMVDEDEE